jgi:hypothetical protein
MTNRAIVGQGVKPAAPLTAAGAAPLGRRTLPAAYSPALAGAAEIVSLVERLAERQGRDDLVNELVSIRSRLIVTPIPVLVVGGPGQGKSSLVNALVGAPICPVGVDRVTAAPAALAYADAYDAAVVTEATASRPDLGPRSRRVPYGEAIALLQRDTNPDNAWRVRTVELGVPSPLLARGLELVDTPPIDDLWSPPALRVLTAMTSAAAVVLVSSASAELTAGELDLLRVAGALCPRLVVVVNGTETFPGWSAVVERNELLLEARGVSAEVFALDASAYWNDAGGMPPGPDPGMQELARYLETVVLETEQTRITRALTEAFWAADRLRMRLSAERALIGDDAAIDAAATGLRAATAESMTLCGPDAAWSRTLQSGIRQLERDVDDDLEAELARLELEARAGRSPLEMHRRIADAVVHLQRVRKLALRALGRKVGDAFLAEANAIVSSLDIAPEAHALLFPRLDRPDLSSGRSLADLPVASADPTATSWLQVVGSFQRADNEAVAARVAHDLHATCATRAVELHRSLVEVLTSLTLLRGVGPDIVLRRRESLATDLAHLERLDWRVSAQPHHEPSARTDS